MPLFCCCCCRCIGNLFFFPPRRRKDEVSFHLARSPHALCVVFTRKGAVVALPRRRKGCVRSKENGEQNALFSLLSSLLPEEKKKNREAGPIDRILLFFFFLPRLSPKEAIDASPYCATFGTELGLSCSDSLRSDTLRQRQPVYKKSL